MCKINFDQNGVILQRGNCKYSVNVILQNLLQVKKSQKLGLHIKLQQVLEKLVWRYLKFGTPLKNSTGKVTCVNISYKKKEKYGRKRKEYTKNLAKTKDVSSYIAKDLSEVYLSLLAFKKSILFDIFKQWNKFMCISSTVKPLLRDQN